MVGCDTVHCGGLGTSEVTLTFKCHLLGWEDLWPAHDLAVIIRGKNKQETCEKMERLTKGNNQKHNIEIQQEGLKDLFQTTERQRFRDLH